MKKWIVVLALLLLAGCAEMPAAGTAEEGEEQTQQREVMDAALVETQARPLTQAEIRSAYDLSLIHI